MRRAPQGLICLGTLAVLIFSGVGGIACSIDSAKNHYVLAEKLWTDRNYAAAVSEFDKVTAKDPRGKLGLQALFRSATTQALFLSEYNDAIRKLKTYVQRSTDPQTTWEAQLQMGDIFFSKTEQYDQAITLYQSLLKQKPNCIEAPELLFRIGQSRFFQYHFDEAVQTYQEILKRFPRTEWGERASLEIGNTHLTKLEQNPDDEKQDHGKCKQAMAAFQSFLKTYPQSRFVPQARFGIASCFEELDRLEEAYKAFSELKPVYPAAKVIEIKLSRIKERIAKKGSRVN